MPNSIQIEYRSNKIKKYRLLKGLTQIELASLAGIQASQLTIYENAHDAAYNYRYDVISKIAIALCTPIHELVNDYYNFTHGHYGKYGDYIVNYRTKRNLSRIEFAKQIDVSPRTLANWENTKNKPPYFVWELVKDEVIEE